MLDVVAEPGSETRLIELTARQWAATLAPMASAPLDPDGWDLQIAK